jgi:3(or 17)beta-hydroxysteroid dehydrogenase
MSSTAALIGLSPYLAYSAAKGGIRAMTKSIAIHCRSEGLGIRCNSVHPGSISTPMVHKAVKTLMGTDLMAEEGPRENPRRTGHRRTRGRRQHGAVSACLMSPNTLQGAEMVIDNGDTVI